MKAIPLLLVISVSLFGQELEPASVIDFRPALHLKKHQRNPAIWMLSACPEGPMVAGGPPTVMTTTIARSDRTGSAVGAFDIHVPYGGGASIAALPDGSFWLSTRWAGSDFPPPPIAPGMIDATALPRGMTRSGPANYDFYTRDGRYVRSFRVVVDVHPGALPLGVSASADEIAIVYGDLIRAGHIANGDFRTDRDWHVNGPHLVFALDQTRFAVVNRMSGEFAIVDPSTPATRVVAVPFKSGSVRDRLPVTAADGSIWFLVHGASGATRVLIQVAPDGSITSRNTLRLPSGFEPLKMAISGRDVYLASFTPVVYRYELR